jgi:RNA polymerase sigma-70 factor (ECF subfamily)
MTYHECEQYLSDVLAGKTSGLQQLYETYYHAVFSLALSILGDHYSAEDVVQEVFVKIWYNVDSYKLGSNPKAWIMGITRNLAIDFLRKAKHETPDETIEADCSAGVDLIDDSIINKLELENALQNLPDIEHQIFVMHIFWDISYLSISRILKMPLATVAWKCSHSVKKLQKILQNQF